jgi:hypothetical protein
MALGLAVLTASVLAGCSGAVHGAATAVPRAAVPIVVDESLNALENPANLRRIARISATSPLRRAIRDAAEAATRGAVLGLDGARPILMGAVDETAVTATRSAVRTTAAELPSTLGPAMRTAFVSSLESPDVRAALDAATAEATRTALLSSFDVIRELHEQPEGLRLVTQLQRIVIGGMVATLALGASALGVALWALSASRRAKGPRSVPPAVST